MKTETQEKLIMFTLVMLAIGCLYGATTLTGVGSVLLLILGVGVSCLITGIVVLASVFGNIRVFKP